MMVDRKKKLTLLFLLILWMFFCSGCGVAVRGVTKGVVCFKNSALFHQGRHGDLSEKETQWAKTAWNYFENNYNPKTGLVNSVDKYPVSSMWNAADFLAALVAARELELIKPCEFDKKLSAFLHFLNTMDLFFGQLPNKLYNTQTGRMVDYSNQNEEIGWSAIDIGRLLIWLKIVKCRYPEYAEYIDKGVLRWSFCEVLDNCGSLFGGIKVHNKIQLFQEGRLGYEEYAAKGFQLWGFSTIAASKIEPFKKTRIYGIEIHYDSRHARDTGTYSPVLSLGYLLDGMEFNWDRIDDLNRLDSYHSDSVMAEIAESIYRVQEARYQQDHILTARTDHQVSAPPFFVYDSIFAEGYPWNIISDNGQYYKDAAIVATKAAFGMWSLFKTAYTDRLINAIACLNSAEEGWFEGRCENTGGYMKVITIGTNAVVLESLLYKKEGNLLNCVAEQGYYEDFIEDPFREEGKCFPLERKKCH